MNLSIDIQEREHHSIIFVQGEVDVYTVEQLKKSLIPLTEETENLVEVNLDGVRYMDSTGLGILIGAWKSAKKHHSHLKLVQLNNRLMRLFKVTGLDQMMDIHPIKQGGNQYENV